MKLQLAIALSLVTACASPAFCDTINFAGPDTTYGHSKTYGSVTAYAFNNNGSNRNLYGKNDGGSEHGVGISGNSDNEINSGSFLQLNTSSISGPFSLSIGSTQLTEGFGVYFSSVLGSIGTLQHDYTDPGTDPFSTMNFSVPVGDFISIRADGSGNVLLDSLTTAATPEPSSLLLLGTGILGAAGFLRRKLSA